ncbi:TPA: HTH domain-containing protein [Klebsiella pneumoniae]|nr:HTH domain-containing protein [Klebsiella pneumoniae]
MTRRADRLFQIVQILRGRRLTTAALLAERLGVSERTVYRDIRDLRLDRCLEVRRTERRFSECADRSLSDFLRKVRCEVREK